MRTKGTGWIALGLMLIAAAAGLTGYNMLQSNRAGSAAAQDLTVLMQMQPAPDGSAGADTAAQPTEVEETGDDPLVPVMEMPVLEVDGREYVGTLELPTIKRKLPVLNGWDVELLQIAPCRYLGSAYSGNLILMAHNYDSFFGKIKNLQTGDPVIFQDVEGNLFFYEVISMETLKPTDTRQMEEGDWDLTLYTCTVGGKMRVTVRCAEVGRSAPGNPPS